jgi:predicted aspartyl protease
VSVVRPLLAVVFASATVAAACTPPASQARLATATGGATGERPRSTRTAKLRYEIRGHAFPLPLVTGTIAGHPVLMVVDTGANSHVIAGWLARKLGLTMRKLGDTGTDHVGKTITTFRIDKPELSIDDWGALAPVPVLATEVPEAIEKLGIGVFISPQGLVEDGDAVLLDLVKGEMRPAWWDEARAALATGGLPLVLGEQARACEENEGRIKGLSFVLPATIGDERAELLVDTGAQSSDLFTTSVAGQRLLGRSVVDKEPLYAASGKVSARKLTGARVGAGAFTVTTDVGLIDGSSDASCPRDGVLAMDVLRSCTLLLGRARVYGRCAAGPAEPPAGPAPPDAAPPDAAAK